MTGGPERNPVNPGPARPFPVGREPGAKRRPPPPRLRALPSAGGAVTSAPPMRAAGAQAQGPGRAGGQPWCTSPTVSGRERGPGPGRARCVSPAGRDRAGGWAPTGGHRGRPAQSAAAQLLGQPGGVRPAASVASPLSALPPSRVCF